MARFFYRMLVLGLVLPRAAHGEPAPLNIQIGQSLELAPGVHLKFLKVKEDSRCPQGVRCVWAGQAVLHFEVIDTGTSPRQTELLVSKSAAPQADHKAAATSINLPVSGLQLWCDLLLPEPRPDTPIDPKIYKARCYKVKRP